MARKTSKHDFSVILDAARHWIDQCLINDGSVFSDGHVWTQAHAEELKRCFVDAADEGSGSFGEKLKKQLQPASLNARRLMAEMLWALSLFPSNAGPASKRAHFMDVWALGGDAVSEDHPFLVDAVLKGIGSAGPAFMMQRWRELRYLIVLVMELKLLDGSKRSEIFAGYPALADWLEALPDTGARQFPHMLRFFAFPDEVERIASVREMSKILTGFRVPVGKGWAHRKYDEELLALRQRLELRHPGLTLDFFEPPLVAQWKTPGGGESDAPENAVAETDTSSTSARPSKTSTNLILYGPPGTGKTFELQKLQAAYTETPPKNDRIAWLDALAAAYGWREVIAVVLSQLGPQTVPKIREHELIQAKARVNKRDRNLGQTIGAILQSHALEATEGVQFKGRRAPYLFTRGKAPVWNVDSEWKTNDDDAAKLESEFLAGQKAAPPLKRYRQVTFHPSFSYEDFVRGIRPVAAEEDGRTEFRVVDGVFKQICDEARANPTKRYALFIDEINRGNIAKIFGELITLVEPDKRLIVGPDGSLTGGMTVQLPGSDSGEVADAPFGVPANLDLYGTMNTADRSIALLDIALRRRFEFREMPPLYGPEVFPTTVAGVDCAALLRRINDRLEYLLDRDHRIGHAYVMKATTLDDLRAVFANQIIPLLQEYFFDDLGKVALTLSGPDGKSRFVSKEQLRHSDLFSGVAQATSSSIRNRFAVTLRETWSAEAFQSIYAQATAEEAEPTEDEAS